MKFVEPTREQDEDVSPFRQILNIIEIGTRNRRIYKGWEIKVIELCKKELSKK